MQPLSTAPATVAARPGLLPRLPQAAHWPSAAVDTIQQGDALTLMRTLPDASIALAATSPPYWDVVNYNADGQIGPGTYERYLEDLLAVWQEARRVLIPNGKLAIVSPIMPIPKSKIADQHTRHLKNIGADIESTILAECPSLLRYSLFVWQKQTTVKMFGSYPHPPNIFEDNTIEFIHVYVKHGAPPPVGAAVKQASKITQEEWRNLSMQVWSMYPADVKRAGGHPAPFPLALPQRLISMYTFREVPDAGFPGDIVLDMFAGSGSTCLAAKAAGRRYIGFDLNPEYCAVARRRLLQERVDPYEFMLQPPRVRAATPSRTSQQQLFVLEDNPVEAE